MRDLLTDANDAAIARIKVGLGHSLGLKVVAEAWKPWDSVTISSLMGDYAATTILLNVSDQHVRPRDQSLLPIP